MNTLTKKISYLVVGTVVLCGSAFASLAEYRDVNTGIKKVNQLLKGSLQEITLARANCQYAYNNNPNCCESCKIGDFQNTAGRGHVIPADFMFGVPVMGGVLDVHSIQYMPHKFYGIVNEKFSMPYYQGGMNGVATTILDKITKLMVSSGVTPKLFEEVKRLALANVDGDESATHPLNKFIVLLNCVVEAVSQTRFVS